MKDDLGGLPARTVQSEGSLWFYHRFLLGGSAAGQECSGNPKRVDKKENLRDDSTHPLQIKMCQLANWHKKKRIKKAPKGLVVNCYSSSSSSSSSSLHSSIGRITGQDNASSEASAGTGAG